MDKEQAFGVVSGLDRAEPLVVGAPIGALPVCLKEIAFRDIGAGPRRDLAQLTHRIGDYRGLAALLGEVGRIAGEGGIGRWAKAPDQRQAKSAEHRRVGRGVARRRNRVVGRSGEPLVELDLDSPMPGGGVGRVCVPPLLVRLKQRRRQPQRPKAAPERADPFVIADPRKIVRVS